MGLPTQRSPQPSVIRPDQIAQLSADEPAISPRMATGHAGASSELSNLMRPRGKRISEALHDHHCHQSSAATLATTHGVGPVARTLRLDYNKLERQVPRAPAPSGSIATPSFVELRPREWLPQAAPVCRIELSDPAGARMTADLACDPATLMGMAQAFWRRG